HIPRPPNAFILFRSDFIAKHKRDLSNQQSISRIAGVVWKALPESERKIWFARAEEAKSAHSQQFPGYQFAP
ncbi:high mobility group box, partial [Schizopora paradoxa]